MPGDHRRIVWQGCQGRSAGSTRSSGLIFIVAISEVSRSSPSSGLNPGMKPSNTILGLIPKCIFLAVPSSSQIKRAMSGSPFSSPVLGKGLMISAVPGQVLIGVVVFLRRRRPAEHAHRRKSQKDGAEISMSVVTFHGPFIGISMN